MARLNSKFAAEAVTAVKEIMPRFDPAMRRTMTFASRDIAALSPASQWPTAQSSSDSPCSKTLWASRRSGRASNRWRPVALTLRCLRVSGGRFCFTKSTAGQCVAEGRGRERLLSAGFCPFARRSMKGRIGTHSAGSVRQFTCRAVEACHARPIWMI